MTVILKSQRTAPVVACNVWVDVGSADEEDFEAGLAHVHEHMLFKGTERRGVGEIARAVEAAGGHINAFTSFDQTCYYVVMSSRFFEDGLDILSDAIRHSSFDADELGRELEVIQEEIKRGNDNPARVASRMLFETSYAEHPYRLPVIGTKESVDSFTRDHVYSFFKKHYVPSNMACVLVGDFEEADAKALVEEYFGDFEGPTRDLPPRPEEPEQKGFRAHVDHRDIPESYFRFAFHIPDTTHEDIPALDLLGAIMGYGQASHLYQVIQRELELVNSIYSGAYAPKDAGIFIVSADYQLEEDRQPSEVHDAIFEETFRFREITVTEADLERARTLIQSQEIYNKQTVEGLAMKLGRYQMVTGDPLFEQKYYDALREVTPEKIREVARKYLHPENCSAIVLHPDETPEVSTDDLEKSARDAFERVVADAVDAGIAVDDHGFALIDLPHGPRLLIQEDHAVETYSIRSLVLGGLRAETPQTNGVNNLLSDLITKGTPNRSAVDIARATESNASSVGGMSGRNSFGLAMTGLSQFFEPNFDIFADVLLNATIPEDEFERERKLQLQDIRARRDKLGAVTFDRIVEHAFSPHPYAMPVLGTEESVGGLDVEAARNYLSQLIDPNQMVFSVVGDVDADKVASMVERYLVRPEPSEPLDIEVVAPAARSEHALLAGHLEKEQAFLSVAFDSPTMGDPDRYATEVLYAILSGQGGRLFYELRDRQSLAYSVYPSMVLGLEGALFTINIGTSPEKVEQALRGIYAEVDRLRGDGVTAEELERAKVYLIGNHDIGLQKNSSRAMSFGLDELYGFGYRKTLEYSDAISEIGREDIMRIIETYFVPQTSIVSVTTPESVKVSESLLDEIVGG
jgi:zinc protease